MEIGGFKVLAVRDYEKDKIIYTETSDKRPTGLPKSNARYYELENSN